MFENGNIFNQGYLLEPSNRPNQLPNELVARKKSHTVQSESVWQKGGRAMAQDQLHGIPVSVATKQEMDDVDQIPNEFNFAQLAEINKPYNNLAEPLKRMQTNIRNRLTRMRSHVCSKVLIVDDEHFNCISIQKMLHQLKIESSIAFNGA